MKHTLLICDKEIGYAQKMAQYINTKEGFPFEARFLMNPGETSEYSDSEVSADILIADEGLYDDVKRYFMAEKILIISGDIKKQEADTKRIYKYQSIDNIIKEILKHASQREDLGTLVSRKSQMKMIGFYSPVGRSGRTSLALAIGQILAKDHKTVFVDMESYSDLRDKLGVDFSMDLSDLMYSMNNKVGDISALIGGVGVTVGTMDVMPSMSRYSDLISISAKEWQQFFSGLETGTDYEYVLLDLSTCVQGLMKIVSMCNRLVITKIDETGKEARIKGFLEELHEIDDLEDIVVYATPPQQKNEHEVSLSGISINGEIGEYAKSIIKEIAV